ncbi:DUF6519 domain-containing protein [Geodermatophilus sp. SYSU D00814]
MATMSPSTFNPLLRYVNVRLQQGVPIVDADVNELDDVRRFELRAFLKWFVGDGVPEGNDGFRITGDLDNDLTIRAGAPAPPAEAAPADVALRHVGRILVDGVDVITTADLRYSQQDLHEDRPGAAALAARLGVSVVPRLRTPTASETSVVYLDVWEHLVTPDDEPDLIHPGLGVETCARIRRDWVVRVRPGTDPPRPGQADHLPGHLYYALAGLTRRKDEARIGPGALTDRRERQLSLPPAHLLADTLGVRPADYRRGQDRPVVSLRAAVNALLAGRLPTMPEIPVSPAAGQDVLYRACTVDALDGLIVVWQSQREAPTTQIVASRLDTSRADATFSPAQMVTTGGPVPRSAPTVVALPGGEVLVAYQEGPNDVATTDVRMKRARFDGLADADAVPVASTAGAADQFPHAVVVGDLVVFFVQVALAAGSRWFFRRYRHTDGTFLDAVPQELSPATTSVPAPLHAAAGGDVVWVAFPDGTRLRMMRLNPRTGAVDNRGEFSAPGALDVFVLGNSATSATVFVDGDGIRTINGSGAGWASVAEPVPGSDGDDTRPAAVRDADGVTYLVTFRPVEGASNDIVLRRRDVVTGHWTPPQRLSEHPSNDQRPVLVMVPGQGIWVFWMSNRLGTFDVFAKRVVTAI